MRPLDVHRAPAGSAPAGSAPTGSAPAGSAPTADAAYLRGRQRAENFPVALRVLPRGPRAHLTAVYDVVRTIDDLGDGDLGEGDLGEGDLGEQAPGDRSAQLRAYRAQLAAIWGGGEPGPAELRRLASSVRACGLSARPFLDLVEANLRDQVVSAYPTFADLLDYCALSANPIGRMVLEIFGVRTAQRDQLSDRICSALQIIEHCQDVAEDRRAGRVYLPAEDLDRFGVTLSDLDGSSTGDRLRLLIGFELQRAEAILRAGLPLLRQLHGWARLAVAGYAAGGLAAISSLRRQGWAVLPGPPRVRRTDVARELLALLRRTSFGSRP